MKPRPAEEALQASHRARRTRVVVTITTATLLVAALFAVAWFGLKRLSLPPTVLKSADGFLGHYIFSVDSAIDLALATGRDSATAPKRDERVRAEYARIRPVLRGYAELAYVRAAAAGDPPEWVLYIPFRVQARAVEAPLTEFLSATGVLARRSGQDEPEGIFGYYSFVESGVIVTSRRDMVIPAEAIAPKTARFPDEHTSTPRWRYFSATGFVPEALGGDGKTARGQSLYLQWETIDPEAPVDSLTPARRFKGRRDIFDLPPAKDPGEEFFARPITGPVLEAAPKP